MDVQVGVSREGLSMRNLRKFLIPLPPHNEQKVIIQTVNDLINSLNILDTYINGSQIDSEMLMESVIQ